MPWTRWGIDRVNRLEREPVDLLPASVGDRSGSAADAGRRGNQGAALSRARTHQRSSGASAGGLPVRRDRLGAGSRAVQRRMTDRRDLSPEVRRSTAAPTRAGRHASAKRGRALEDYVRASRTARTGYHDWRWRDVFERAFGHDTIYFAARRRTDRRRAAARAPRQLAVRPGADLAAVPQLRRRAGGRRGRRARAARRRGGCCARPAMPLRRAAAYGRHFDDLPCKQHKVTMLLPLQQAPALWDGLDKKVRNQVRKAQKSGLTYATAAPSCSTSSTPCSRATCATSARRSTAGISSPRS